ncbi:TolC family outer membrane protein [Neokomagataea thailandica]|nr:MULTISPECIES: TolC family outer membrane protein [Neokomagataea]
MRKAHYILSLALFSAVSPLKAQTLNEALEMAYKSNPTLQGERANQRAVTENSAQARSGWRPTVTINVDANYQKGPYTGAYALGSYTSNYAEGYVQARQTLYSFGHVANQVKAADARSRAEIHALEQTENQVFTSAITAYMDVLRDRAILDVRKADLEMLRRQVQLTTSRYNLGGIPAEQVTKTDVEQAQARLHSAEVGLNQARATLASSEALFRTVIGVEPGVLVMPEGLPGLPNDLGHALKEALASSPQFAQSQDNKSAADADIDTARSQWGPQIQAQGMFGTTGPASPFRGRLYGEQMSGTVSLVQPLYNGDLYNSQIRQARDKDEQARHAVELARRTVLQNVAASWSAVENGLQAISAGAAEVHSGETTLKGYQLEYGYGLRSTTDVLYADQNLRSAQVELASSGHDTIVAEANLLASMGRLQAQQLLSNNHDTHGEEAFRHARRRGWEPLQAPISALDQAGW